MKRKNTKKELYILSQYLACELNESKGHKCSELYHVYGSFSNKKQESFDRIKDEMEENNGKNLYILSHNGYSYTCAYIYYKDGECHVVYHSKETRKDINVITWLKVPDPFWSSYGQKYYGVYPK